MEVRCRRGRRDVVRRIHRGVVVRTLAVLQILAVLLDRRDHLGLRGQRNRREWCAWDAWDVGRPGIVQPAVELPVGAGYSFQDRASDGDQRWACRVECLQFPQPDCLCLAWEPVW